MQYESAATQYDENENRGYGAAAAVAAAAVGLMDSDNNHYGHAQDHLTALQLV